MTISVLGDTGATPEHGHTTTRADGRFDFRVLGGRSLTLSFAKAGYMPVQRRVDVPADGYLTVEEVVLRPRSTVATPVALNSASWQWAAGEKMTDARGTRTGKVLFPAGTQATFGAPDRPSPVPGPLPTSMSVRLTEYTSGDTGQRSMPGSLPATSAFTYAVDISVDGYENSSVTFSKPVALYLDSFIDSGRDVIPVGSVVPVGFYDRTTGSWKASDNGRVIQILGFSGDKALIDVDGVLVNGAPSADATSPSDGLGYIPDDEKRALKAAGYAVGTKLWRVPVQHFSIFDCNFPYGPCSSCKGYGGPGAGQAAPSCQQSDGTDDQESGSIIGCEHQTLGEVAPVLGTPFHLRYASQRTPGRVIDRSVDVKLGNGLQSPPPTRVLFEADVAGQHETRSFTYPSDSSTPFSTTFTWDGLDGLGQPVQGVQLARLRVGYEYPGTYYTTKSAYEQSFGTYAGEGDNGQSFTVVKAANGPTVTLWQEWTMPLGSFDPRPMGLGGWTLSHLHLLDPISRRLYRGDGTTVEPKLLGATVTRLTTGPKEAQHRISLAGYGDAYINANSGIAVLADGCVVVPASTATSPMLLAKLCAGLPAVRLAGGLGANGHSDGGGDPTQATFGSTISAMATSPDGKTLLVAERASSCDWRIRRLRLSPAGTWSIDTIAGNSGTTCVSAGDGGPLTAASFNSIDALAYGYDGSIYLRDAATVRRVSPGGKITRIAGAANGAIGTPTPNTLATQTSLDSQPLLRNLGVDAAGRVYLTSTLGQGTGVYRIDPDGYLRLIAGGGMKGASGDGLDATNADLGLHVYGMTVDAAGRVVLAHSPTSSAGNYSRPLRLIETNGVIQTIAPSAIIDTSKAFVASELAFAAVFEQPAALAWGADGSIAVLDALKGSVRQITTTAPGLSPTQLLAVDPGGNELYVFSSDGRHQQTVDALTGVALWKFEYDPATNQIWHVTDRENRVTTITHPASDQVMITSPTQLPTKLSLDTNGWISKIDYPSAVGGTYGYASGVSIVPTADSLGLLTSFQDARNKTSIQATTFKFDALGRLTEDREPTSTGGVKMLSRSSAPGAPWQVDVTTADDRTTSHRIDIDANGSITRTRTDSDGSVTTAIHPPDGTSTTTSPAGQVLSTTVPDPLFGTAVPRVSSMSFAPAASMLPKPTITVADSASYVDATAILKGQQRSREVTLNGGPTWSTFYDPVASTVTSKGPQLTNTSRPATVATLDLKGRVKELALPWASEHIKVVYYGDAGAPLSPPQLSGKPYTITQGSRVVTLTFDSATGFLTSVKDPLLQTTTITPDGLGRTRKVTAPDASVLAMTPDEGGLLMSLTPPGKSAHQFTYDDKGRPKTYVPPAGSDVSATTETTAYTKDGLFVSLTSPGVMTSAVSVTYEPEPTSKKRLSRVDYPDKHIDVAYDDSVAGSPRLKSLTSSNGEVLTLGWTGSVLTSLQSGPTTAQHTVSWPSTGFDSALRPTQEQLDAGNTITTGFDNDGFPLSTSDGSWTLTHTRAPSGLVASASFTRAGSTPLNETFGHEASFGEPNDYQFTVGNAVNPLYRVEILARDALGRIRLRRETVAGTPVIRQYDYDAQGRLKTESSCSGVTVTMMGTTCTSPSPIGSGWSYDDNGNRDPQSKGGPNKYDGQDRLTDVGSSTHYTYTTDGRLQTKVDGTGTTSYGYDVAGSLQSVGVTGKLVEYKVDALGRRVERKLNGVVTARWVYGRGLGPVAEFNAAGVLVARYVYARGRNVPDWAITAGGVYRFITDERGSVRLVVRSDGVVVRRQDYDVWGVMTKQNPPPPDGGAPPLTFGFAGGLYDDDTKLVRFGARDYDAQLGRWTSKDPLRLGGGDTNFYKYAGSDPVNNSDPSGLIVSLCSDPAQLPGTYVTGARHNWLMTDAYQGGQVSDDGWFIGTKISTREHTNRNMGPSAMCTPIEHVDEQCVNRMLGSDISSGWWLWDNTCRDVAEAIVQVCTLPGYPDASTTMPVHDVPSRLFQDARKYGFINDSVCENQFPFSEFP